MKKITDEIELLKNCAVCNSTLISLKYQGVRDWTFNNVDGTWSFFECEKCNSLFLNPRLTRKNISFAYNIYYTHGESSKYKLLSIIKKYLILIKRKFDYRRPSYLKDIEYFSKVGKLLDIGCGNGRLMIEGIKKGWIAKGIELDHEAVRQCKSLGLDVIEENYSYLNEIDEFFELIICNHVIEHVYDPIELIELSIARLKPGGVLWLQWPNPQSKNLIKYGIHWRGLEAPRHISLPTIEAIKTIFSEIKNYSNCRFEDVSGNWLRSSLIMRYESDLAKGGYRNFFSKILYGVNLINYIIFPSSPKKSDVCTLMIIKKYD